MKTLAIAATTGLLALGGTALAQATANPGSAGTGTSAGTSAGTNASGAVGTGAVGTNPTGTGATGTGAPGAGSGQGRQSSLITADKLRQDLQKAGFTDVRVVAESFVVQARSKDGDPILMTVGPHGMSVFQAVSVDDRSTTTASTPDAARAGSAVKVSRLNDMQLYNARGEALGDVEQVVRGSDGQTSLVIGRGGLLGLGERHVAVPLDKVAMRGDRLVAQGLTDAQIQGMPAWNKAAATALKGDETVNVAAGS